MTHRGLRGKANSGKLQMTFSVSGNLDEIENGGRDKSFLQVISSNPFIVFYIFRYKMDGNDAASVLYILIWPSAVSR